MKPTNRTTLMDGHAVGLREAQSYQHLTELEPVVVVVVDGLLRHVGKHRVGTVEG